MRLKSGFMLRNIADQWIVIPLGERTVDFSAIINLSETGAFIWNKLEADLNNYEILEELSKEYEIDENNVEADLQEFMYELKLKGLLENE